MTNTLGEVVLGEELLIEVTQPEPQYLFMYGRAPQIGSQTAFIHGFVWPIPSFALNSYIEGKDTLKRTTDPSWGTEAQAEAEIEEIGGSNIVNLYEPKMAYMNGSIKSLASTGRMAYIVMNAKLMDIPTNDGKENYSARRAQDFGPHEKDILLFNAPTWVRGPHD